MHPGRRSGVPPLTPTDIPADLRAAQFAIQLLNDLVTSRNARSSVWDAQVELLQNFVHPGTRTKISNAPEPRAVAEAAPARSTRDPQPSAREAKDFVPMS